MKFIKNGIIYEPHSEFVIEQMKKGGEYMPYEEKATKPVEVEKPIEEEKPKRKKK